MRPFYGDELEYPDQLYAEQDYLESARTYAYDVHDTRFCTEPTDPPVVPEPVTVCPD
jgi:hypothetical protein